MAHRSRRSKRAKRTKRIVARATLLLLPVALFWLAYVTFNGNPEVYRNVPGFAVEGRLGAPIKPGLELEVIDVQTVPRKDGQPALLNSVMPYPGKPDVLLYNDMRGTIGIIERSGVRTQPFMDANALFGTRMLRGNLELGLISFAFHPDFAQPGTAGEGRFYTVHSERPAPAYSKPGMPYFGLVGGKPHHLSVLSEWRITRGDPLRVDPGTQRIVLVLEQPHFDHNLYHIAFNPTSIPGDSDFGMLYIGVGNGGVKSELELDDETLFGKILRVDPLPGDAPGYAVPAGNPFGNGRKLRPEVWASGFRNPQHFSWNPRSGQLYAVDIGHSNVEEINLVAAGENYGWSYFEGRFLHSRGNPEHVKEPSVPLVLFAVKFPVAAYDHTVGKAVAGGFVYGGEAISELQGAYVFGDIVNGRLFYFDAAAAESGEQPQVFELQLYRNGEPTSMAALVGEDRVDLRLGLDGRRELLLLNKQDNVIRGIVPRGGRSSASPGGRTGGGSDLWSVAHRSSTIHLDTRQSGMILTLTGSSKPVAGFPRTR